MTIRLAILLLLHGFLVCAGLVSITVMFSIMNDKHVEDSAKKLTSVAMRRNIQLLQDRIDIHENAVKNLASSFSQFKASAQFVDFENNREQLGLSWTALGVANGTGNNLLGASEMWKNYETDDGFFISGCLKKPSVCFVYDPIANTTAVVPFDGGNKYLFDETEIIAGPLQEDFTRDQNLVAGIGLFPSQGLWSSLYLDGIDISSGDCTENSVVKSMAYYYCMNWTDESKTNCAHVMLHRVNSNDLKSPDMPQMTSFVYFANGVDNVNGLCAPSGPVKKTLDMYFKGCGSTPVGECPSQLLVIDNDVCSAVSLTTDTGLKLIEVDVVSRSYFNSLLDQGKQISIAIAVCVIVIVLLLSIFVWIFTVIPIQKVSRGLEQISTLSSGDADVVSFKRRYMFITEMGVLYESYLALRKSLLELKAFVPQGLFVAPTTNVENDYLMQALLGSTVTTIAGGPSPSSSFSEPNPFGHLNDPHNSELSATTGTATNTNPVNSSVYSETSIVHILPVPSGVQGPQTSAAGLGDRAILDKNGHVYSPRSSKSKGGFPAKSSIETPPAGSLLLNLNGSGLNTFRNVMCSFVMVSFSFQYMNADTIEEEVTAMMDVVVKAALRCGGVIEVFRPDQIAISFGAHSALNQHAQIATLCAVTMMSKIPSKRLARTRILVDAGPFFVGNCGAHERIARVVFGQRFDFCMDLLKYEIGLGRLLVTDRAALCLPSNLLVPVDYIISLNNRIHGIQMFQFLDPTKRHDKVYKDGAARYRKAYMAALSGEYTQALALVSDGNVHDAEMGMYFTKAMEYLISLHPKRPRFCRFQLPQFEPLGSQPKRQVAKLRFDKVSVNDINGTKQQQQNNNSSNNKSDSIQFGLGGASDSGDAGGRGAIEDSQESFGGFLSPIAMPSRDDDDDDNLDELPLVITDHKGQVWHRLPKPLDAGSFAKVYKAISYSGSLMALKCIELSAHQVQLNDVVSEVNVACKLFNEHIVNHTGWAHIGGFFVIIMDYIGGGSLYHALSAFPKGLPMPIVKRYSSASLKGLAYLHANGIVHADIKPHNILLTADGSCKIADFGSSVTKANAYECAGDVFNLRGTALYMSPEVARGDTPTRPSDVWSLGITIYQMLTGELPWVQLQQQEMATSPTDAAGDAEGNKSNSVANEEEKVYVPVQGVSDVRFVQGLVKGTIIARVLRERLPSDEAYDIVCQCLETDPTKRQSAAQLIDHPFFLL